MSFNAAELEQAFIDYNRALFAYAYSRTRHPETAENIVQEVFMKAWRSRETFDGTQLKSWLFTIARNTIFDFFKRDLKKQHDELVADEHQNNEDLARDAAEQDLIDFVFEQTKKLSDREQELLVLRYQADLSIREIAELLDLGESAVKVAIHRAVKKLKKICNQKK